MFNNGAFYELHRSCSNSCKAGGSSDGYAFAMDTYTYCCNTRFCNNWNDKKFFNSSKKLSSICLSETLFAITLILFQIKL